MVIDGTVGAATLGPVVAAYTATAHGIARTAHRAVAVVAAALALTWFLDPVDLSREGAVHQRSRVRCGAAARHRDPGPA